MNRFVASVRLEDGAEAQVHVASSGRMTELLIPGAPVYVQLTEATKPDRKTVGLLAMVQCRGTWVSVDTSMPGKVLRQAFKAGTVLGFSGYTEVRPEYTYGDSRLDFLLTAPDLPPCLVEVKSVTSVLPDPDGTPVARFPDAPTERGAKHLRELMQAMSEGYRSAVCFMVQRADAEAFGPWEAIDPAFSAQLRIARDAGVEVHAIRMDVQPGKISLGPSLPLRI